MNSAGYPDAGLAPQVGGAVFTTSATRVAPVARSRPALVYGRIVPGMRRDGRVWWVMFTGVAPDGVRYRLSEGQPLIGSTEGSARDWLTASH